MEISRKDLHLQKISNFEILELQKITTLSDNSPSKFWTKYCIEINDGVRERDSTNGQVKFKNTTLKSFSCNFNDAYILLKYISTVSDTLTGNAPPNNVHK